MADETTSRCVFVTTNKDTNIALLLGKNDPVSVCKDKICQDHKLCFPTFGNLIVSAVKVKSGGQVYHLPDSMTLSQAFQSIGNNDWFLAVDLMRAEDKAGELLTKTAASSNPAPTPTLITHGPEEKSSKKRTSKTSAISDKSRKKPTLGDLSSGKREVEAIATGSIAKENFPTDVMYQPTVAENQGLVVATSEPMQIEAEIGNKDIVEKADEKVKSVKPKKKKRTKAPAKEAASSSQILEPSAEVTKDDPLENLDNVVKKIVEEA